MYLHPLIASVSPADRAALVSQVKVRSYRRKEIVLNEDEWTGQVYCVAGGVLRVVMHGSGDSGDVTTDFIRPDDFFLSPSLREDRYQSSATLIAALPASVYVFPVPVLRDLCGRYPHVAAGLLELTLARGAMLRRQIRQLSSSSTERLISHVLHELTQVAPAGANSYDKRISQSVIASYSGLSREQVNKTMRDMETRGLVKKGEHAVQVPAHFAGTDFTELPLLLEPAPLSA